MFFISKSSCYYNPNTHGMCDVFHLQILRGSPGVKPSEPLVDFIHSFHDAFKGGIFWINGRRQELVDASVVYIKQVCATN